ncbi:MAG: GNAT family N-acetyltransferase [Dehalococcoidia bacterium]|nr:GNAT family N-acetyltransferase [Dehalococcoidia bacterium]
MYSIRPARAAAAAALQELDGLFSGSPHSEALFRKAISEGKVAVAESSDGVVGYVLWDYFWDDIPLCLTVRVDPPHQRRGVGRRLYEYVEDGFRRAGCTFWLSSTEEDNERSRLFHERLGFRRIGALEELSQDAPEVFYRKDIS